MTWEELWSIGRIDLGLTSKEFWGLTPRQFFLLAGRVTAKRQRQEWGPALVTAALFTLFGGQKKPASPFDFMPSTAGRKKTQSVDEQMAVARGLGVGRMTGGR